MEFRFLEVDKYDKKMLEKIFHFRYKVFLELSPEYLENYKCTDNIENDKYDKYSIHFVALDYRENVIATVRLIHNSPVGYPTENCLKFDNTKFKRNKLGEMSRIFVDAKYRNIQNTKEIIHEVKKSMYIKMMTLGIEYTYGSLEASFLRLLRIYKMRYEIIGEKQLHVGLRYPCILYTNKLAKDNKELIELWKEISNV